MDINPGSRMVGKPSATSPSRGKIFAKTSAMRIGWVSDPASQKPAVRALT